MGVEVRRVLVQVCQNEPEKERGRGAREKGERERVGARERDEMPKPCLKMNCVTTES